MDSFNTHFSIVDITDNSGFSFSVLVKNDTGHVVNPDISMVKRHIGESPAKSVSKVEKKQYYSIIEEHFVDKPNIHEKSNVYYIKPTTDLKTIKLKKYRACSICCSFFLTESITNHIVKCAAEMNEETLTRTDAVRRSTTKKGFSFKAQNHKSLYVILQGSTFYKMPDPPKNSLLTEDAFVREKQLSEFLKDNELAIKFQISKEFVDPFRSVLCDYFNRERKIFSGGDNVLLLFMGSDRNGIELTSSTNKFYTIFVAPVLYLLAVLDDSFSFLLGDIDLPRFNKLVFEKICSRDNDFMVTTMKAIYYCFVDPFNNCFKDSTYRCNVFKSMRSYFRYTVYDGLQIISEAGDQDKMFECYRRNTLVFENVSKVNTKYHNSAVQKDDRMEGTDTVYISGTCYSVKLIRKLLDCLSVEYRSTINTHLQKDAKNIDGVMNFFCSKVQDDHSNSQHGYTPFESPILKSKLMEYVTSFRTFLQEGTEKKTLDKLLFLSRIVCLMVELSVGHPYEIEEMSLIRYRNMGIMRRSLFFNPTSRTFNINLAYKRTNNLTQGKSSYYRVIPTQVASYLVHLLFVVRPIVISLFGEEPIPNNEPDIHFNLTDNERDDLTDGESDTEVDDVSEDMDSIIKSYAFITNSGRISHSHFSTTLSNVSEKYIEQRWTGHCLRQALRVLVEAGVPRMGLNSNDGEAQYQRLTSVSISKSWHQLLGFGQMSNLASKASRLNQLVESAKFLSFKNLNTAAREIFVDGFSFSSEPLKEACQHIYSTLDRVMVNTATDSGKFLTYLLPAMLEKKSRLPYMTVVVVPFVSLLTDAYDDAKTHLNARIYDNEVDAGCFDDTDVLFVQVEKYSKFVTILEQFESQAFPRFIRRIVVDEFHVLEQDISYRSSLFHVKSSLDRPFSFVFLSATVNDKIFLAIKSKKHTQIECFKGKNIKPNVLHSSVECDDALTLVRYILHHKEYEKMIIVVNNKVVAEGLAEKFQCLSYTADVMLGSLTKAHEVYESFKTPTKPGDNIVLCTGTFSTGLYVDGLTHVIIVDEDDPVVYHQLTGRINRGKNDAKGYVYRISKPENTFNEGQCINKILSGSFYGEVGDCMQLGCMKCSVCDPSIAITKTDLDKFQPRRQASPERGPDTVIEHESPERSPDTAIEQSSQERSPDTVIEQASLKKRKPSDECEIIDLTLDEDPIIEYVALSGNTRKLRRR